MHRLQTASSCASSYFIPSLHTIFNTAGTGVAWGKLGNNMAAFIRRRVFRRCVFHRLQVNTFATDALAATNRKSPDPRYVNLKNAPEGFDVASAVVYPRFISAEEGKALIKEASTRLKRRRFEDGHWDAVIQGYREVELSTPYDRQKPEEFNLDIDINDPSMPLFAKVIEETRRHIANHHFGGRKGDDATCNNMRWLPSHAIDLSANGELSAHVDSVKFSGGIVAGLSLLSDSIMRLRPASKEWDSKEQDTKQLSDEDCSDANGFVDLYLPQLSLYILSGMSRQFYTHELLPTGSSFELLHMKDMNMHSHYEKECEAENIEVIRGRRLSIIFRDAHHDS